jgi:hypothetical protein
MRKCGILRKSGMSVRVVMILENSMCAGNGVQ